MAYVTMLLPPLIAWSWAMRVREPTAWKVAMILGFITAGGAMGATLGWLATGKPKGLTVGYLVGALVGFLAFFAATFWLAYQILR